MSKHISYEAKIGNASLDDYHDENKEDEEYLGDFDLNKYNPDYMEEE